MILENSPESVVEAKKILGIPAEDRIGFIRREWYGELVYQPVIEKGTRRWYVGDEILPE